MFRLAFRILVPVVVLAAIGWVVYRGIHDRIHAAEVIRERTAEMGIPSVAVVHATRGAKQEELSLPGNIQAFADAPVYARTNGYLKKWYFDIGSRVRSGDLLAEIEAPELDQQVVQAKADLATAQSNLKLAETTMNRYQSLVKLDAIPKQDVDNAVGAYRSGLSIVESQTANLKRLEQLVAYEKVYAPFDGIITARNTDVGQLVNAGNGGSAQELFHIASASTLRIFVSVPQLYKQAAAIGTTAVITLIEAPGRKYVGKVTRNAGVVDASTRTILTEVDLDNSNGQLMPGSFAEVHLKLPAGSNALVVPVTAMIFRAEGLRVAVVRDGNRAELVQVTQGRDFGNEVEITSGITEKDEVIINAPDTLSNGSKVRVERKAQQQ